MPSDADVRETPPELFTELNSRFRFTLDAAATHSNAKCAKYNTEHGGAPHLPFGIYHSWEGERVYCNPPFSDIAPWVIKAWESNSELVYMLVPATRTEQGWWQDLVEPFRDGRVPPFGSWLRLRTEFLRGRTRFLKDGARMGSPKFGCVGLLWER
jgi:phage N-6-adenine-methyltransferase